MNIVKFDEQEFEKILDEAQEAGVDVDEHIQSSFKSLLFLGTSVKTSEDANLLNVAIFNIRLCYVYFKRKEDYQKLSEIAKLSQLLNDNSSKGRGLVDEFIMDSINVNLN